MVAMKIGRYKSLHIIWLISGTTFELKYRPFKCRQQIIQTIFEAAGKEDRVTVIQNGDADFNFDKSSDTQKILDICQQFVRDFKSSAAMST